MSKIRVGKIEKLDGNAPTLADLGIIGNGDSNGHVSGLTDLVDVDFSTPPVGDQILSYDSASSFWKPVDLNYDVTLTDVTQYQSSLQITEGQITDLQTYLTSVAFSDLTSTPSTIVGYGITDAFDGNYSSLSNIPSFATVATSGSFTDLLNKPGLGNLTDVTTTGVTTGQVLKWSGTQWQPANDTVGEDGLDSASAICDRGFGHVTVLIGWAEIPGRIGRRAVHGVLRSREDGAPCRVVGDLDFSRRTPVRLQDLDLADALGKSVDEPDEFAPQLREAICDINAGRRDPHRFISSGD